LKTLQIDIGRLSDDRKLLQGKLQEAKLEMSAGARDVETLCPLSAWLILRVLSVEALDKAPRIIWGSNEVNLLVACWEILMRRNCLQHPAVKLDMVGIGSLLRQRGVEEFEGAKTQIPSLAYNRANDGLAELVSIGGKASSIQTVYLGKICKPHVQMYNDSDAATKLTSPKEQTGEKKSLGTMRLRKKSLSTGNLQSLIDQATNTSMLTQGSDPDLSTGPITRHFQEQDSTPILPKMKPNRRTSLENAEERCEVPPNRRSSWDGDRPKGPVARLKMPSPSPQQLRSSLRSPSTAHVSMASSSTSVLSPNSVLCPEGSLSSKCVHSSLKPTSQLQYGKSRKGSLLSGADNSSETMASRRGSLDSCDYPKRSFGSTSDSSKKYSENNPSSKDKTVSTVQLRINPIARHMDVRFESKR